MATVVVTSEAPALNLRTESSRSSLSASAESSLSASTSTSLDTSTRTSILRTSSSSSVASTLGGNISFAPLPSIEPRRRKSNVALGVAARSRMLAIRRQLREQGINPNFATQLPLHFPADGSPPIPIWEHDPDAELRDEPDDDLGTDPAEEAFAAIGKFVKGATRTLFRRKSSKDTNSDSAPPQSSLSTDAPDKRVARSRSMDHLFSSPPADPHKDREEGGVWEEEVGSNTWAQLRARTQDGASASDTAYKRTSTVEVIGKNKKTGTLTGKKTSTTDTKTEVKTETKAETTTGTTTTTTTTTSTE
ncbi:uncharacterized protein B0H18DRAFT_1001288 [Fomitopsis serialis]|uniref:uncharacterized protein n=1 Tax=Fomitopsis serialis TaxID=139415 RepID=UPI002007BD27|nr:uncharacterized protein B0H18DRAFT_1001288 [Neoantrodia serialis]KAH9928074.1 hypothetical protein B0H18DRAFT_1001288 [Neoantrodia serialis]